MRPLRLTMNAFGPYAGTETVDFDALTELGLFVVAGNNGSGKTTIFDALHYALYGMLPGRRASYLRLKSDHADDKTECSVTLDFVAHGTHWRVERSPKQKRAKRRGNGTTEAPTAATLYRLEQGTPTAVTNRVEEVRAKCAELVGLSGKQFERVALLPQGQFSRVLTESSTERRELLRTLFSSEIFDTATSWLTESAAEATAGDRQALERLDHRQEAIASELAELTGRAIGPSAPALHAAFDDHRRVELGAQRKAVEELDRLARQAAHDLQAGVDLSTRLERRRQVRIELQQHEHAAPQHYADVDRLHRARAAVPVTSNARALAQHHEQFSRAEQRLTDTIQRLDQALVASGLDQVDAPDEPTLRACAERIAALEATLGQRRQAALQVHDTTAVVTRGHAELRRMANDAKTLAEQHELASAQLRQARAELGSLDQAADIDESEQQLRTANAQLAQRIELAALEAEHAALVRQATELDATSEQLAHARETALHAQSSLAAVQQKADAASADYQEAERRSQVCQEYHAAATKLRAIRAEHSRAQAATDELWHAFIAGTAARVAQTLADDEPCPVCGSCEHPSPAIAFDSNEIVTQGQVTTSRSHSETLLAQVRAIESQIEAIHAGDPDIATLVQVEADALVSTKKAMAFGARTVADDTRQAASLYERVDRELSVASTDRAELDDQVRSVDQRRSRLQGALGVAANEPVAALRAHAAGAAADRARADQLAERGLQLHDMIDQASTDVDRIGLEQIAAESRRTSAGDQLAAQQQDLDVATQHCLAIDTTLASMVSNQIDAGEELELRVQSARHAQTLTAQAITALARQQDAAEASRRAQSFLDDRLRQSCFNDLEQALAAYVEPHLIEQLEAQTAGYTATGERLRGQLDELAELPDGPVDIDSLEQLAQEHSQAYAAANSRLITTTANLDRLETELTVIESERSRRQTTDLSTRRLERVAALAKGDNDRNTSLENWVLAAHLRDVVELANIRLARSTHQRFQLCVMDDGENKRGKWGLDLGVEDTVTGTRRPTAGLSGGELFQASLALALGLADAVMNQSAGVRVDALFIDEGFGSLDETSVERAIDLLDELRDRGAMVGVITHVPALLEALPRGVSVTEAPDGHGSTIQQSRRAA